MRNLFSRPFRSCVQEYTKKLSNFNPLRIGKLLLPCAALSVMLLAGTTASANGPTVEPLVQIAQAPTFPSRATTPVAPPPPAAATDANTDNAKLNLGIKGHCFCNVTCTSSKGQTLSPGEVTLGGTLWQHLANDRAECQQRCQQHINSNIQAWAAQGKLCDSVTCTGTSRVGTNSERRTSQHSINLAGTPACTTPSSGGGTCCPPMNNSLVKDLFSISSHPNGNGGQALFSTSGPAYASLVQGYQAYLTLLKFMCPKVERLNVQFSLHTASGIGGTLSATPISTFTVSFPSASVTPALPQFSHVLATNQVYGIQAVTVGVDARGNPVDCGFDKQCNSGDRYTFGYNVGSRIGNPGVTEPGK